MWSRALAPPAIVRAPPHSPRQSHPPATAQDALGRITPTAPVARHRWTPCRLAAGPDSPGSTVTATCRHCKKPFVVADNHDAACRYHPMLYTGGEVGKATGFVRRSQEPEDQLKERGIIRFWDCCGARDELAPGCQIGRHVSFDEAASLWM